MQQDYVLSELVSFFNRLQWPVSYTPSSSTSSKRHMQMAGLVMRHGTSILDNIAGCRAAANMKATMLRSLITQTL